MPEVLLVRTLFIEWDRILLQYFSIEKEICLLFYVCWNVGLYHCRICFWHLLLLIVHWEKCRINVCKEASQTCKQTIILFSLSRLPNLGRGLGHGLTMWFWLCIQLFWTVLSRDIFQYTGEEILANIWSSCEGGQHRYTLSNCNISGLVLFIARILRSKQPKT